MIWGWGHLYTPYVWDLLGGISTFFWHFGVSQYIHCLSVHNSHVSCSPSLPVASLLDLMLMVVCYASCCCTFLCSFIMSQASPTTAMTTTPLVTVVSSGMSSLSLVTIGPSLMGFPATLGQHDVVLPLPLTPRHSGGVVGLASVPQQQLPSQMPLQAYANYVMGPPQVGFFFRVEPSTILYIICLVSVLMSAFCFQVPCWMLYSPMGAQPLGFAPLQPFGAYPWQAGICTTW